MQSLEYTSVRVGDEEDDDDDDDEAFEDEEAAEGGRRHPNRAQQQQHEQEQPGRGRQYHRQKRMAILLIVVMSVTVAVVALWVSSSFLTIWGPSNNNNNNNNKEGTTTAAGLTTSSSSSSSCSSNYDGEDDPRLQLLRSYALIEHVPEHGMVVASDQEHCSQMGLQLLRDHAVANAVDAAVTVALCLGVANPASSGMGGGAFLLIHAPLNNNNNNTTIPFIDARTTTTTATQPASDNHNKVTEVIDCRETAPAAAHKDMFLQQQQQQPSNGVVVVTEDASTFGGLACAIPGELQGLELAHARHGNLPWASVVQPVYQFAQAGVLVNANLAHEIQRTCQSYADAADAQNNNPKFLNPLRKVLTKNDDWNQPLLQGDILYNPALASTLKRVMEGGSKALFAGSSAETLAMEVRAAGGIITASEFQDYRPTLRTPVISHDVFGFSLVGVPPPSSGGAAVIGILRFLYYIVVTSTTATAATLPLATTKETLTRHWFVEACRHIFAIRMALSDPDYNTETVRDAVRDLVENTGYLSKLAQSTQEDKALALLSGYGGEKWAQLQDHEGAAQAKDGKEGDRRQRQRGRRFLAPRKYGYLEDHGTSHFSVVDKHGNAVSMTTSVNTYFGSNVMSESTGIIFNNQMDDFATPGEPNAFGLPPAESNFIVPGKKPLSSMSPTLIFRTTATISKAASQPQQQEQQQHQQPQLGSLVMALGASGGPKIITAVAQVILNHLILGLPLFESIVHPRIHDQLLYRGAAITCVEHSTVSSSSAPPATSGAATAAAAATMDIPISLSFITRRALERRNHKLLEIDYAGAVQAVSVDLETYNLSAVCDVRKGGAPAGY